MDASTAETVASIEGKRIDKVQAKWVAGFFVYNEIRRIAGY